MKKRLISFVFLFVLTVSYGQKVTEKNTTVTYSIKVTKNNKVLLTDECELRLIGDRSYFFSLNKMKYMKQLKEKIEMAIQKGGELNFDMNDSKMLSNYLPFSIVKDKDKDKTIFIEDINDQTYGYIKDTTLKRSWTLTNDTLTINGLLSYKAIYEKDSFRIVAWYCPTIPIQDGPFTYNGLPGIITKVENNKGWYAEIINLNLNDTENISIPKYILTTEDKFKTAKSNFQKGLLNQQKENGKVILEKKE